MASPLKITFPANLPKNEKDLICMLLAGRLKDLFKGRLVCAQLAIDDLIKETTGISALGTLRESLVNMNSAINGLKAATGYNAILNGVNQALGQINNVFSLGGLCPSPVHAPKIPDVLAQLNANLFGQANNILNALGKAMNPSMCLGGGPGGFGINWNSFPGDLKNLKAAIAHAKSTNGGMTQALLAFERNLKSQVERMNSEIKRLQQNLADPLGLNSKLNTSRSLQRAKSTTDGYPVRDAQGILHKNALRSIVAADIEAAIDNGDKTIITYKTVPILNYCGDIEGYKRVAVSGPLEYAGWDPNNTALNADTPTINPTATYLNYDYLFKEENNLITVYDTTGTVVTSINISRGNAYRFGFELVTSEIKFYSNNDYTTVWTDGFTYSRSPDNGGDLEVLFPDDTVSYIRGDLDWRVLIENPTTPNTLYWKSTNNQHGNINVDPLSPTVIPEEDRTYDIAMAMKKSYLHLKTVLATTEIPVDYDVTDTEIQFMDTAGSDVTVNVVDDVETTDINGNSDSNNKIIKTIVNVNGKYLIIKRFVNTENLFGLNKIYFYTSSTTDENIADKCVLLKFDDTIYPSNSTKLPYALPYSYELAIMKKTSDGYTVTTTPVRNSDQIKFEFMQDGDKQIIRYNITMFTEATKDIVPENEFILQTDIEISPLDLSRSFVTSNPVEARTYVYLKFADETVETIILKR
jgi:hypothetical protein